MGLLYNNIYFYPRPRDNVLLSHKNSISHLQLGVY